MPVLSLGHHPFLPLLSFWDSSSWTPSEHCGYWMIDGAVSAGSFRPSKWPLGSSTVPQDILWAQHWSVCCPGCGHKLLKCGQYNWGAGLLTACCFKQFKLEESQVAGTQCVGQCKEVTTCWACQRDHSGVLGSRVHDKNTAFGTQTRFILYFRDLILFFDKSYKLSGSSFRLKALSMDTRHAGVGGGWWAVVYIMWPEGEEYFTLKLKWDFLLLLLSLFSRSLKTQGPHCLAQGGLHPLPTHEYTRDGFTYIRAV